MKSSRISSLDGIRAIAVMLVIYSHAFLANAPDAITFSVITGHVFMRKSLLVWSDFGVELFFVLSGFLITTILLKHKQALETKQIRFKQVLKNFYLKRVLRIFPIYFAVLLIALIVSFMVGSKVVAETLPYEITFTVNLLLSAKNSWYGEISHLWSLAAEMQFYLIWPFILLLKKSHLQKLILFVLSVSVIYYFVGSLAGAGYIPLRVNLPGIVSYFAAGAYFAVNKKIDKGILLVAAFAFIVTSIFRMIDILDTHELLTSLLLLSTKPLLMGWFISRSADGWNNTIDKILNNRVLVWLGGISYGIYLFHYFILAYLPPFFQPLGLTTLGKFQPSFNFIVITGLSILFAWIGNILIEKPFLKLKEKIK